MATKRPVKQATKRTPGPVKGTGGRPIKGPGPAAHVMSLRLSDEDRRILDALLADQEAKLAALGVSSFAAADMVRLLLREEYKRRQLGDGAEE